MRFFSWPTITIYSFLILVLSIIPIPAAEGIPFPFFDKFLHGLAYCFLSFITVSAFRKRNKKHAGINGFTYSFLLGLLIEMVQYFIPYRSFEAADIAANFLGSLLGCLFKII